MTLWNPWLALSLLFLALWAVVFLAWRPLRRKMAWASAFTAPFGLTEPLFVPAYWQPPSAFDLAQRTGFDLESIIFSFAIGGLGSALYEALARRQLAPLSPRDRRTRRHRFHLYAILAPVIVFVPLQVLGGFNPIYSASLSILVGGVACVACRPDLAKQTVAGGAIFLGLYFLAFSAFNLLYPGAVQKYWNLEDLSGVLLLGVPLEELMFASMFGMMWSSLYEHAFWLRATDR